MRRKTINIIIVFLALIGISYKIFYPIGKTQIKINNRKIAYKYDIQNFNNNIYVPLDNESNYLGLECYVNDNKLYILRENKLVQFDLNNKANITNRIFNDNNRYYANSKFIAELFDIQIDYNKFANTLTVMYEDNDKFIDFTDPSSNYVLVNNWNTLNENFVPSDLIEITNNKFNDYQIIKLDKETANHLHIMIEAAEKDDMHLLVLSGYRPYSEQVDLYEEFVYLLGRTMADKRCAKPGSSEHQTGLGVDINCQAVKDMKVAKFEYTKEAKWIKDNSYKYGFILRYPKDKQNITGVTYEPWHIRYVGIKIAKEIHEKGITLEEYYSQDN